MCGIAGILSDRSREETVRSMCDSMVTRGPDEEGFHSQNGISLGIRRLSIIDPEGGHQPVYNDSRTIGAVCNGEIYNHRELREELGQNGYDVTSGSDVAVLPYLYQIHGTDFV
ncbi:MAG: asparagine synthetase B, partial [bacterium]